MLRIGRALLSVVLLLIVAACVYSAFATKEMPRDSWWAWWTIQGAVGISCLFGAVWLLLTTRTRG